MVFVVFRDMFFNNQVDTIRMQRFTAAQAANKCKNWGAGCHCYFTAAQAANKGTPYLVLRKGGFTAAQAANKIRAVCQRSHLGFTAAQAANKSTPHQRPNR